MWRQIVAGCAMCTLPGHRPSIERAMRNAQNNDRSASDDWLSEGNPNTATLLKQRVEIPTWR
jgi:hypothetical protein